MVYDRKILVPYLENLYSLEMARVILSTRKDQLQTQVQSAKKNIKNYNQNLIIEKKQFKEALPLRIIKAFFQETVDLSDCSYALTGFLYCILFLPAIPAPIVVLLFNLFKHGIWGIFKNFFSSLIIAYIIFVLIMFILVLLSAINTALGELDAEKREAEQTYQEALQAQATKKKRYDTSKNTLPQAEAKLAKIKKELPKIETMLSDSYNASITPS